MVRVKCESLGKFHTDFRFTSCPGLTEIIPFCFFRLLPASHPV